MADDSTHDHYERRIRPNRPGYEIADWADAAGQRARFQVLLDHVDLVGLSLLDVGCGTGDLWAFLAERQFQVEYLGVDVIQAMVDEAARRYPDASFACADVFRPNTLEGRTFDVVFASGVFNLDTAENRRAWPAAVAALLDRARQAVVFNLLHIRAAFHFSKCLYRDPVDVLKTIEGLPAEWQIVDDYLPNDFTVIGRKT